MTGTGVATARVRGVRRRLLAVLVLGAALAAGEAHATAGSGGAPVSPERRPVIVRVGVDRPVDMRLLVTRDGRVVAASPPMSSRPGTVRLAWGGGRGPGFAGATVPDGRYRLRAVTAAGRGLPTSPSSVRVDATPPRVGLRPGPPTVPLSNPRILYTLRDPDLGGARVRAIVSDMRGRLLAAGPWGRPGDGLPLPPSLARRRVVGQVQVVAEARDVAGNRTRTDPVPWAVQPAAGPAIVMRRVRTRRPVVALTFDDGYDAAATARILGAAEAAGATVTFCFNAVNRAVWSGALRARMRAAVRAGVLEGCSHGYSHRTGVGSSQGFARADLARNAEFDRILGVTTIPFYRPPYGAIGPGILAAATELGYRYVLLWDVDTNDWRGRSAEAITRQVVSEARPGSIVLMHARGTTATALPGILRGLRARGLRPAGIGEVVSAGSPAR